MRTEIERSIRRTRNNKSTWKDEVHNEILKVEPLLIGKMLYKVCKLVGRTKIYPESFRCSLLTEIYKKGNPSLPRN